MCVSVFSLHLVSTDSVEGLLLTPPSPKSVNLLSLFHLQAASGHDGNTESALIEFAQTWNPSSHLRYNSFFSSQLSLLNVGVFSDFAPLANRICLICVVPSKRSFCVRQKDTIPSYLSSSVLIGRGPGGTDLTLGASCVFSGCCCSCLLHTGAADTIYSYFHCNCYSASLPPRQSDAETPQAANGGGGGGVY